MRVAVVVERTTHLRCEGRRRVEALAGRLADRGHDVGLFCTQWWDGHDETRRVDGLTHHAVTVAPARTSYLARVPYLVGRFRPDVVVAAPEPPSAVVAAKAGAALARAHLVVDWFGDEDVAGERATPWAVRAADRVVVPSRHVQTEVRELGAPEETTAVVPASIDLDLVRSTDPAPDAPDLVYAGRLDGDANVEDFLLALAELRDREWTATVFGDGPERAAAEQQARELRVDDRVTFAGDTTREERLAAYRGAHVFVHTDDHTCFATELLGALSCGCVGVVEYQPDSAAHELVERRERGFRVSAPEEIADAFRDAGQYAEWTVDDSLAEYDHDAVLDRYLDLLRSAP